jgi:hypothetical protein
VSFGIPQSGAEDDEQANKYPQRDDHVLLPFVLALGFVSVLQAGAFHIAVLPPRH